MSWVLGGLLVLLAVDLILRWPCVRLILPIFEQKPAFSVEPAAPDPRAERFEVRTSDGLTLRGSIWWPQSEQPSGVVLFCPELGGNQWMATDYCGALRDAGFVLVAFDFRNQGESDAMREFTPSHWLTGFEVRDIDAVLGFVQQHPALSEMPLGVFGVSRGGTAALVAAARHPHVQRVACDSVFSIDTMMYFYTQRWATLYVPRWIMRLLPRAHVQFTLSIARRISQRRHHVRYVVAERALKRLTPRPILLIAGDRDSYVPLPVAEELRQRIGESAELWIVPNAKHNGARALVPNEYDVRLVSFFEDLTAARSESCPASAAS